MSTAIAALELIASFFLDAVWIVLLIGVIALAVVFLAACSMAVIELFDLKALMWWR